MGLLRRLSRPMWRRHPETLEMSGAEYREWYRARYLSDRGEVGRWLEGRRAGPVGRPEERAERRGRALRAAGAALLKVAKWAALAFGALLFAIFKSASEGSYNQRDT